jgi:hypothetical protein
MHSLLRVTTLASVLLLAACAFPGCSQSDNDGGKMEPGAIPGGKMDGGMAKGTTNGAMDKDKMGGAMDKDKMGGAMDKMDGGMAKDKMQGTSK